MSFSASMHDPFIPFDKFSAKHPREPFRRWHEPEICRVSQFVRSFLYLKERRQSTTLNLKFVCIRNLVWVLSLCFTPVCLHCRAKDPQLPGRWSWVVGSLCTREIKFKDSNDVEVLRFSLVVSELVLQIEGSDNNPSCLRGQVKSCDFFVCLSSPQKNP